ncbi:MFS transporter [Enemella sp. A6]|uniref:MFS transporter n=1 Tax=Enemella sp. A6 TaxID=3440152 RepID=UPI003EBAFB0B
MRRRATIENHQLGLLDHRHTLWLTGAGLSLIAACYGLARFAYGLFVPTFRLEFSLDATAVGAIASGSFAAYCVAIVLSSVLTPRFGGRAVAIAAGTIATAGVLLVAVAPNVAVLALGVLIAGSSTGVASPPLVHAVAHSVALPARNRTQTVINAGSGIGVAAAGPVALFTQEDWRAAWLVFAVLCAVTTLWVAIAVPSGRSPRRESVAGFPRPLLPSGSVGLIAAAILMGVASSAVWTFGRDVLVNVGGLDEAASTIAWILLGTFGLLGAAAGDLTRRVGVRTAWTVIMLIMGAATVLLAALPVLAWVAAAAFGAAYVALTGMLLIWGTDIYHRTPAAGAGLPFLALAIGQVAGAPLIGALSEAVGSLAAFGAAALIACGGAALRTPSRSSGRHREPGDDGAQDDAQTRDGRRSRHFGWIASGTLTMHASADGRPGMESSTQLREIAAQYSLTWPKQYLALADEGMLDVSPRQFLHFNTDFEVLQPRDVAKRLQMLAEPNDFRHIDPAEGLLPFGMEPNGNLYCFHTGAAEGGSVPVVLLQDDDEEDLRLAPDLPGFVFVTMVETVAEFYDDDDLGQGDPRQNAADWLSSHEQILIPDQVVALRELFVRPLIERDDDSMGFIEFAELDDLIDPVLKYPKRHEPIHLWQRG